MNKPWFWNLLLLLALAVTGTRLLSSLGTPSPLLPVPPEVSREPGAYPAPSSPRSPEGYEGIAERNLFHQDRGKVEPPQLQKAAAPPPDVPDPPKATLFGVVMEEDGDTYAFLSETSKGGAAKPKKYRAGDSFSGARIKEIRSDRVVFTVGSVEHTVALRTPKEGIAPPPPTPSAARVQRTLPGRLPRAQQARRNRETPQEPDLGSRQRVREPPRRLERPSSRRRAIRRPSDAERYQDDPDADYYEEGFPGEGDVYYEESDNYDDYPEEEW